MKKTNKIILTSVIVAVLLLGIGYAAIQNITLNIAGTAAADPSQANFKVMFSGIPTVSDDTYATAAITDDTNAIVNVEGLTKKGDIVTAIYTVQNASTDLSADLGVSTTNSNTEYFTLSSEIAQTSLVAGEATTLTVTVELTKTPIKESVRTTIGVQLEAMPVQPGEEGSSEGINGSAQTPEQTKIITFIIGRTTYEAEVGMTWANWIDSAYNTDGFLYSAQFMSVITSDYQRLTAPEGGAVSWGRQIQDGEIYGIPGVTPPGREIVFYIAETEFIAEENMTWADYISSEYNLDEYGEQLYWVSMYGEDYVGISTTKDGRLDFLFTDNSGFVHSTDIIQEGYDYGLQSK